MVNYRSFGFTKILPRVSVEKFAEVVQNSVNSANALPLWNEVSPILPFFGPLTHLAVT